MSERPKISIRLSPEARAGWERACVRYGITMTAYIEAIGLELAENDVRTDQGHGRDRTGPADRHGAQVAAVNLSTPESVEQLRRSIAMLSPGAPALDREDAMRVLARLLELMPGREERPSP